MNSKKRSVFFNVILINTFVSFILVCIFLLSFLYFNSRSKQENLAYANNLLQTLAQTSEEEMNRLSTLTAMLDSDPSFVMVASNKLPAEATSEYVQNSFQKLRTIAYSLPYAESVFLYRKADQRFFFITAIATKEQYEVVKNKGLSLMSFPEDMTLFDFENLGVGFHPINENYSVYVTNILNYGSLIIKIDTAKFFNFKGINAVLPSYSIAVLDNRGQTFAVSSPNAYRLLKSIDLKSASSAEATVDQVKYEILQKRANNTFRFVLIRKASALQNLEMQNSLVGILISIAIFAVCVIIILVNAIMYSPLRKVAQKFGGSNNNEIDFIDEKLLQLTSENALMQQQIGLQRSTLADIELSYAIHTKGDISNKVIDQMKAQYGQFFIFVVALQSATGDGEEVLSTLDDFLIHTFHCKVIVIDPYVHAYLTSDVTDVGSLGPAIEQYLSDVDPVPMACVGISDRCDDVAQINRVYQQAYERMLDCRIPKNKSFVISAKDSATRGNSSSISFEIHTTIAKCVLSGSRKDLDGIFQNLFFSDVSMTLRDAISKYLQLSNFLWVLLGQADADVKFSDLNKSKPKPVYNPTYMYQSLLEDYARLNQHRTKEHSPLRYGIIEYIDKHYSEPLSLESIAAEFRITPVYLSTWFKKNTGMNLSVYLSNKRMEEAKRIMAEDKHIKISDVSRQVGIPSVSAFIRQFKNYAGTTPDQYRRQ